MESLAREVKSIAKSLDPSSASSSDASKSMCVICLSEIKEEDGKAIFTGECSHSFHFDCITENAVEGNRICPICRFQWTQVPTCDVLMLEKVNWMVKKREKETHEVENRIREMENELDMREEKIHELKMRIGKMENKLDTREEIIHELKVRIREMENELDKRDKMIHELKMRIREMDPSCWSSDEDDC